MQGAQAVATDYAYRHDLVCSTIRGGEPANAAPDVLGGDAGAADEEDSDARSRATHFAGAVLPYQCRQRRTPSL